MKRFTNKEVCLWLGLILSAILLQFVDGMVLQYPILAVCKYLSLAYAIVMSTFMFLTMIHMPRAHGFMKAICVMLSSLLILFYTCLTIDTFLFHTLDFYPGMFRYVFYSTYEILYLIFIIPGILVYLGKEK